MKEHFRSWKIGRLYFRLIKGTEWELMGWTAQKLAAEMERLGFIKRIFEHKQERYIEMPGKYLTKSDASKLIKGGFMKLTVLLLTLGIFSCATNKYKYEPTLDEYEARAPYFNAAPPSSAELTGQINQYDGESHTCTASKIMDIDGSFSHWYTHCN